MEQMRHPRTPGWGRRPQLRGRQKRTRGGLCSQAGSLSSRDSWVFAQLVPEASPIPLRACRQLGSTVLSFSLSLRIRLGPDSRASEVMTYEERLRKCHRPEETGHLLSKHGGALDGILGQRRTFTGKQ